MHNKFFKKLVFFYENLTIFRYKISIFWLIESYVYEKLEIYSLYFISYMHYIIKTQIVHVEILKYYFVLEPNSVRYNEEFLRLKSFGLPFTSIREILRPCRENNRRNACTVLFHPRCSILHSYAIAVFSTTSRVYFLMKEFVID